MELNKDCVRHLLLYIEKQELGNHIYNHQLENDFAPEFGYSDDEVEYATRKLKEAGFVKANGSFSDGRWIEYGIGEMTWEGHQFLDNIRDDKVWKTIKNATSKLTDVSISLMSKIGWSVIKSYIHLE